MGKHFFLLICFLSFSVCAIAQEEDDPLAPDPVSQSLIPLDTTISIKLLSRDTTVLDYYTLYGFEYKREAKKIHAELMIPRKDDVYRGKALQTVTLKLCRVTRFVNSFQGMESPPVEVEDFIEITKENGKDKQYYNFDPSLPNVVLTTCDISTAKQNKR